MKKPSFFTYFIIIVSVIFLYFTINVIVTTWGGFNWWFIDFERIETANFASLIAGIFSFISSLLIIYTIYYQILQSREQNLQFSINQFENNFFKLIDYNTNNVKSFSHVRPDKREKETNEGAIVFKRIFEQFLEAFKITDSAIKIGDINDLYINNDVKKIDKQYIEKIVNNENSNLNTLELLTRKVKIDISYLVMYYGTPEHDNSISVLKSVLSKKYSIQYIDNILNIFESKKTAYYPHQKYFGGHQGRLGHYFRNLFHCICYVDNRAFLTQAQKRDYIKLLRSQFTNYEQALIFLNSLSTLGKAWEYDSIIDDNIGLLSNYEIIKNIPQNFLSAINIHPNEFYPSIKFEYEN